MPGLYENENSSFDFEYQYTVNHDLQNLQSLLASDPAYITELQSQGRTSH